MTIENAVAWYNKNVNCKLTKVFLEFLIDTGIIEKDINLEKLNLYLLDTFDGKFVNDDGKFKIKKNRLPIIDKFKGENKDEQLKKNITNNSPITITKPSSNKKSKNKFKIENLGGKRLKLVKI